MEEQRIGKMYVDLFTHWVSRTWHSIFRRGLRRSPALPWLIILVLVGLPSLGWYLHRRGRFATLKRDIKGQQFTPSNVPSPGGREPIVLRRTASAASSTPELTSVTLLPGLGMGVLQVTAAIPGHGEVALLANPTVQQVADEAPGSHTALYDTRGAIEAPWGGLVMGLLSPIGTAMTVNWQNHRIQLPLDVPGRAIADGGLLSHSAVDSQQTNSADDGAEAVGVLHSTSFDDHWPSQVDLQVRVVLEPSSLLITLTAKNTGTSPLPFGAGWHPRFAVPEGTRDTLQMHLPEGDELEITDKTTGQPSGRIVPAAPEFQRFQTHPAVVDSDTLEGTLVHLKPGALDTIAAAELRDRAFGYGLRLSSSASDKLALRVIAPANTDYVSLGLQTNYDDPFGREWKSEDGSGLQTLSPGQSFEWKVRLEIFPVLRRNSASFQ